MDKKPYDQALDSSIPPLDGVRHLLINLADELPADLSDGVPFTLDDAADTFVILTQHAALMARDLQRALQEVAKPSCPCGRPGTSVACGLDCFNDHL